jgi:Cu/Zn superoxide dismutase
MKTRHLLTWLVCFWSLGLSANHLSSTIQVTARCNGGNEVPAVMTQGQGLAVITLNKKMTAGEFFFQATGLSGPITGIHIHAGLEGENGPVLFNLTPFLDGDMVRAKIEFDSFFTVNSLLDGEYYLNVHTEDNPGGEIRGQLKTESDLLLGGALSGDNEVPAVMTSASGYASAVLSLDGSQLQVEVLYDSLSGPVTGAHLHMGAPGTNGGVVLDLSANVILEGLIRATVDIDLGLAAMLRTGGIYVNVHTLLNPGGEIRAQLEPVNLLGFDCLLDGDQEVPSVMTDARGLIQFHLNPDGSFVRFDGFITGLTSAITGAHIHMAGPNANGDVVIDLSASIEANGRVAGMFPLDDETLIEAFLTGNLYVNVHTEDNPAGEIRGQVYRVLREGYFCAINGGQEVPPVQVAGRGVAMVSIDRDQGNAHYMLVIDSLEGTFTAAHFHAGAAGENGPVVFDLTPDFINGTAVFGYWFDLGADAALFRTSGVYVNIHTDVYAGGELRGNFVRGSVFSMTPPKNPNFSGQLLFAGRLSGSSEVPGNDSRATGVIGVLLNEDMTSARVNLTVDGLRGNFVGAHFHLGAAGENGPVVVNLTPAYYKGRLQMTVDVDSDLLEAMLRGEVYVNVHTDSFPGGEVRAQVLLEKDLSFGGWLTGDQEVPAVMTSAMGLATFNLTPGTNQLEVNVLFDSLSSTVTGAHLHMAEAGSNGGVVVNLGPLRSGNMIRGTVDASAIIDDLFAGDIYINVHTEDNPGGEIRGQLDLMGNITFDGWLSGSQEVPPVPSPGMGFFSAAVNASMDEITVNLITRNLTAPMTGAHFHFGGPDDNGGVWLDLSGGIDGNVLTTTMADPDGDGLRAMLKGEAYINVHTQANPGGEIRTQTYGLIRDGYSFDMCPEQETSITAAATLASGSGIASIDRGCSNLHLMAATTGLTDTITGIHIHHALVGNAGPVILNLASGLSATGSFLYHIDEAQLVVNAIKNGAAYVNVHTTLNPGGEVRGQIVRTSECRPRQRNPIVELVDPLFGDQILYTARLSGVAEVPPVATDAVGVATVTLNDDKTVARLNLTVSELSSEFMGVHIHAGLAGTNGPVLVNLSSDYVNGKVVAEFPVSDALLRAMARRQLYVNVHTENYPGGEIRGQIALEASTSFIGGLSGNLEVPPSLVEESGLVSVHVTPGTGVLEISALWEQMDSPVTGVHLHRGARGSNGPVVEDLTDLVIGNSIRGKLTAGNYLADLFAGNIYLNVHTEAHPDGAIRAQLDQLQDIMIDAWLTPEQEVPSSNSNAIGLGIFQINATMDSIQYLVQMDNLSDEPTVAHFHNGRLGENGSVVFDLSGNIFGNLIGSAYRPISPELLSMILSGEIYINVHTAVNPAGEIRGQMYRIAREGYAYDLCPEQEVNGTNDAEGVFGSGMFAFNRDMDEAHLMFVVNELSSDFTGAHIHSGAQGVDGNVFVNLSGLYNSNGVFTYFTNESQVAFDTDFAELIRSGNAYVNVHTTNNPGGEVRGQIIKDAICPVPTSTRPSADRLISLSASPNPASDQLFVEIGATESVGGDATLVVYDIYGKAILSNSTTDESTTLNLSGIAPGTYLLRVTRDQKVGVLRFVVQ